MNSLSIPTDSLYKFLAIVGIFIAIVPSLFLYNESVDLRKQIINTQLEADILNIEVDYLKSDVDSLMKKIIAPLGLELEEFKMKDYPPEEFLNDLSEKLSPEDMDKLMGEVAIEVDELILLTKQNEIKLKEIENKQELYSFLNSEHEHFLKLVIVITILGLGLACLGFYLWYSKVQIYQDKLLKRRCK